MCIGIPMQIVEVYEDGISGVVEAGGTKKHCFLC
jgi:hydrogenase expression/formation protein HypC